MSDLDLFPGDVEIRHLEYRHKRRLGELLAVNDVWKDLMSVIPMADCEPGLSGQKMFTSEDVHILDRAYKAGHAATGMELLIEEWGTMGRKRPTVKDVLTMCQEIEMYAAASYISTEIMKGEVINAPSAILDTLEDLQDHGDFVREKENGLDFGLICGCPEVNTDEFDAILEADLESSGENAGSLLQCHDNSDFLTCPVPAEDTLLAHRVPFAYLCSITKRFAQDRFIDRGGFATVYEGITLRSRARLAVKKLQSRTRSNQEAMMQQLNYEVDQLPRLKHPNIIELLGYSNDSPEHPCLLYPFMAGGTLEKRLRLPAPNPLRSWKRMEIALGVAKGLHHLHSRQKILIHRDIKTSNILLDEMDAPKIADFGLLRYAVSGEGESVTFTQSAKGTPAYMPPEAIACDLSAKWDVWSYGVVMLELLTGLSVMDRSREDHDLTTHIKNLSEEVGFSVQQILDAKCNWNPADGQQIFQLADQCLKRNKKHRPTMLDIIKMIQPLLA